MDIDKIYIDKKAFKEKIRETTPELKKFTKEEIKEIRLNLLCTQKMFADILGITKSALEKWETGTTYPNGSASRLLALIKNKGFKFIIEDLKEMG